MGANYTREAQTKGISKFGEVATEAKITGAKWTAGFTYGTETATHMGLNVSFEPTATGEEEEVFLSLGDKEEKNWEVDEEAGTIDTKDGSDRGFPQQSNVGIFFASLQDIGVTNLSDKAIVGLTAVFVRVAQPKIKASDRERSSLVATQLISTSAGKGKPAAAAAKKGNGAAADGLIEAAIREVLQENGGTAEEKTVRAEVFKKIVKSNPELKADVYPKMGNAAFLSGLSGITRDGGLLSLQ
jgi:hypothetical protein